MLKFKAKKGFSLIEAITAVFIVSMALVSVLAVAQTTVRAQTINKYAIISSMLAQEGLELVRNVRDTNWRSGSTSWTDNIVQDGTFTIYVNPSNNLIVINSTPNSINDAGTKLYQDANGYYVHGAGNLTPFRRLIQVNDQGNYLEVTCIVQAQGSGNDTYTYKASTLLYDWW
jgi:type II secretory pathway pseudopilin PulG